MGEIADDMINGQSCSGCGIYFEKAHGYPVHCHDCYVRLSKREKKTAMEAFEPEIGSDEEEED